MLFDKHSGLNIKQVSGERLGKLLFAGDLLYKDYRYMDTR